MFGAGELSPASGVEPFERIFTVTMTNDLFSHPINEPTEDNADKAALRPAAYEHLFREPASPTATPTDDSAN